MQRVKCTVIGDSKVGKTCLLISFVTKTFPDYIPVVFNGHASSLRVDPYDIYFRLWDTASSGEYERLRPLIYPGTDIILMCFSVSDRMSYINLEKQWLPELEKYFNPLPPIVVVACKSDLRSDKSIDCISSREGVSMAIRLNAGAYIECSAKELINLTYIFHTAVVLMKFP
jgi:small GTP-binding protein